MSGIGTKKFKAALISLTAFAILNTFLAVVQTLTILPQTSSGLESLSSSISSASPLLQTYAEYSPGLAPVSWIAVAGVWVWRGRMRLRWKESGFERDDFEMFMRTKGGPTRIRVLQSLASPKDRLQLASELSLDWKTADDHVRKLARYGFIHELAFGKIRIYELTPAGAAILQLVNTNAIEQPATPVASAPGLGTPSK